MRCLNHTTFSHVPFETLSPRGEAFTTLVMKATMRIRPGAALELDDEQEELVLSDEYYGDPTTTSVRRESDLAAYKPRSEVLFLDPIAHAPDGRAMPSWPVSVRVGSLRHEIRVTGPRVWAKDFLGSTLSSPVPIESVPIRYERAFGGTFAHDDQVACHHENSVGTGITLRGDPRDIIPAPQVEMPSDPIGRFGRTYAVAGLGPIDKPWLPRRTFAGTFDEAWKEKHWPLLPLDHNFEFNNAAPMGLRYDGFFRGDEPVRIEGMHPDGAIEFALPGHRVFMLVRRHNGEITPVPSRLDTLTIDVGAMRAYLTYRAVIQTMPAIRVLEGRMLQPEEVPLG